MDDLWGSDKSDADFLTWLVGARFRFLGSLGFEGRLLLQNMRNRLSAFVILNLQLRFLMKKIVFGKSWRVTFQYARFEFYPLSYKIQEWCALQWCPISQLKASWLRLFLFWLECWWLNEVKLQLLECIFGCNSLPGRVEAQQEARECVFLGSSAVLRVARQGSVF